ncbi:hypothetical protein FRUB_06337 [Fimbriiglobus ruber]|uniref:Uncharacterized protein n=1 Tax=Fimbriiglobus ruber TaxID=1908690 RepID=A0A225DBP8_9BACT|nr:hypothetical protein FRUB_06337 [Fimbriiglobus ruber]
MEAAAMLTISRLNTPNYPRPRAVNIPSDYIARFLVRALTVRIRKEKSGNVLAKGILLISQLQIGSREFDRLVSQFVRATVRGTINTDEDYTDKYPKDDGN